MLGRVFVTGMGVVSSIGLGKKSFFRSLGEGKTGISPVSSFDASQLGRQIAGEVKDFDPRDHLTRAEQRRMGRCSAMAVAAARMALADANLPSSGLAGRRTAVVIGTTMGEAEILGELERDWIVGGAQAVRRADIPRYGSTLLPIHVARAVGAQGMVLALPAACAAGNYALGFAADLIRSGRADVAVAGAAELIQELQFSGFVRLAAMAPEKCQPFDLNRQGLLLGEGAGLLVVESEAHAARRGARPQAEVGGYGLSCDAYHITRPHPDATGSIGAMRDAIRRSGLVAGDIDFVNAHGTGTRQNDAAESKVVREVFGARRIPISSMKSMLGHCMGAASALEAIGCVFTLETGLYPPTIGYETRDPECDVDVVANFTRTGKADIVINNSLAFGGYNAVSVLARPGVLPPARPHHAELQ
ncbi:MAG TPA: beta-ketoacyl-[acyl-carrier-protein] synthase family protein [Vicinamibacterales bacterium]|nr:beta-ketoacyl-[acyl-carrier-protein] synthase family protein [Vicinamibacterales bacterium]